MSQATHYQDLDQRSTTELLQRLANARSRKHAVEAEIAEISSALIEQIDGSEKFTDRDGHNWVASVVQRTAPNVNLERLREIDEDLYIDATKRVYDDSAFQHLIASGRISDQVVSEVASVREYAKHIRLVKVEDPSE